MSFPRYPTYKDSGVEWLGKVPTTWLVTKLGRVAFMQEGPGLRNWQFTDEGTRVICVTNITENGIDFTRLEKFISVDEFNSSYQHFTVQSGDVLLSSSGNSWGKVAIYVGDERVMLNTSTIRLNESAGSPLIRDFLAMMLQSDTVREQLGLAMTGSCQPNFGPSHLSSVIVAVPSKAEQSWIATFLDRETSKIAELIAEQRRLIHLLKEKRQAVISHAVTKGLNPHAPMKPSRIEWLGDVPEHWEVKSFQRCVAVAEGQVDPKEAGFSEMFLIAPNHIQSGTGQLLHLEAAEEQGAISGKYFCKAGDVIYSKIRPALRKVCIAPQDCLCSADMYPLHAHSGMTNEFLFRWILTEQFSAFAVLESDRVAMPKINRESLKEVRFALPPIDEQRQICDYIATQTVRFDGLVAEAERAIDLLQERRTALISAAVTGKIDVRSFVELEVA